MFQKEEIREATKDELDSLLKIWIAKSEFLMQKGIRVWDPAIFTQQNLEATYIEPRYYVGTVGNDIFGIFILVEQDPAYWPEHTADSAYYFHKFTIPNAFSGKGYGTKILNWVKDYGRKNGKDYIRLDFNENRDYLRTLYYGNGFTCIKEFPETNGSRLVIAEYALR